MKIFFFNFDFFDSYLPCFRSRYVVRDNGIRVREDKGKVREYVGVWCCQCDIEWRKTEIP